MQRYNDLEPKQTILLRDLTGLSIVQSASSICLGGCHALLESDQLHDGVSQAELFLPVHWTVNIHQTSAI